MITGAELAEHRADAQSRMGAANGGSDVNVYRKGSPADRLPQDEETGREVPRWEPINAEPVPFRLGGTRGANQTRTVATPAGDMQLAVRTGHFPASTGDLADGDLLEIVAGENAGTFWQVVEADWADQQTARRVPVVAAARPQEWWS